MNRKSMIDRIARQLCNDEPVFDGHKHWTMDDVYSRMDEHADMGRLNRMLIEAQTDFQKGRATEAFQLLFRQCAYKIADEIVDGLIMYETIKCCHGDFDAAFDSVFKVQGV